MTRLSRSVSALAGALVATTFVVGCPGGSSSSSRGLRLDETNVPENLRDLVPIAEKWGTCDNLELGGILSQSTVKERADLREAVQTRGADIASWLDSFEGGAQKTDEAFAFTCMVRAVNELPE